MAINDDVLIDITNRIVKRESGAGATVYTVNALYTFIQDTFDELSGSEGNISISIPMSAQTPTSYTMINGWYIQEELTQYLTGGAVQTSGYDDEIRSLICSVTLWTPFIPSDVGLLLTGGTTNDTGTILDYDNANYLIWVRMTSGTDTFDDADEAYTSPGTGIGQSVAISTTGEMIFANPYTLGTLEGTPQLYIYQAGARLSEWWSTGQFDVLIKVTQSGVDIDSKAITVFGRNWTDTCTVFKMTLTTAGQNAVPLGTADDLNNQTAEATVEDWQDGTTYSIAVAYSFTAPYSYDIGDGAGPQDYDCQIDCDNQTLDKVYEVAKYWTTEGSAKQLEEDSDANFINGEAYRFADSTYTEVVVCPFGTFAGGVFFAAQGCYFINLHADDAQNFQLIDNAGVTRTPPNYQNFAVTGVVAGDRVAIFKTAAGIIEKDQYTSDGAGNVAGDPDLLIQEAIPNDTPTSGTVIMVATDEVEEHVYRYNSWATSTYTFPTAATGTATGGTTSQLVDSGADFVTADLEVGDIIYDATNGEYAYVVTITDLNTLVTTVKATSWSGAAYETNSLVQTYDGSDTAYVPYVFVEAAGATVTVTVIYVTDRTIICRVRLKGILPFETSGSFTATGYAAAAIRTTDSIVS